jgi:hypothetical protein
MGYRLRLGKIPKTEKQKYSGMTEDDVWALLEPQDDAPYRPPNHTELYELGKYVNYADHVSNFYDFELGDCEFWIMSKDGLLAIIQDYHKKIHDHYKDLLEEKEDRENFLRSRVREWDAPEKNFGIRPYYLDEEHVDGEVVRSWQYEYAIFNLTYIYRHFDWENDYLIYSGW